MTWREDRKTLRSAIRYVIMLLKDRRYSQNTDLTAAHDKNVIEILRKALDETRED